MAKFRITSIPQNKKLDTYAGGGEYGCADDEKWDDRLQKCVKIVQNLSESTIYDPAGKKIQTNLFQKLKDAKDAYQNFTKQHRGKKYRLNEADSSSSIEQLRKGIQLYKDEYAKEQESTKAELKKLENLKSKAALKGNTDIQNLSLKDLSTTKGKMKIDAAIRNSSLDSGTIAALYKGFGLDEIDANVKKGSGPNAQYSAKEAKAEWKPEIMQDVGDYAHMAAMGALGIAGGGALSGAAGSVGNAVGKVLSNPFVATPLTAYGVYDATTNTIPEAYRDFSEGRYLEGVGNTAMAALDLYLPGFGKGIKTGIKGLGKVAKYAKNMEPAGVGPLMLLKPTGDGLVQKNIPYYKQLLDSYDTKKMSAGDKKFYNTLIDTANKQNGMLTQAQLNELDRLKTGNFDFGKRGYNKESLIQVEPKSPLTSEEIGTESAKQSSDSFADEPKTYLTNKQSKEQGYKIENDLESDERLILNKNGNYAGQIEILTPETSSTGEKFAGINIDLDYDHRGKKLSKAMYDAILDRAKEQGIDGIISIDSMLDSPKQSKAIRKYFDGEYTSDPKLLKDIHTKIDGINEDTIKMFGKDEPLIEKPDKVYIIKGKKQATESKTKRKLSQKIQDLDSLLGEGLGYLVNNKNTQKQIDEGNTWLKNWIGAPETQAKIDTDFEYVRDRALNNPSPWGMMDAHDLAYMQAKSFEPNSKMFPLKKQFRDYRNSKSPIHSSNFGVSYLHGQDPYVRHAVNNDTYTPFERYGSWISRSPFTKDKVSTTIHEGTHDWVGDFALTNSGQKASIESNYTKEQLDNLRQWQDLKSKGIKPETVMGNKKTYEAYMSDPTEVHARIMELRKHFNLTPKSTQEITTEEAKKILKAIKKSKTPIDSTFADVVNNDPDKLKYLFKRLWAAPIATAGAVGTASMLANPFEGSDGLQQQKKGGATKNFIELELPKNEIQDYINQGYIVEEVD